MAGSRAPVLAWCNSLTMLLSVANHVTGLGPVSPAHMQMVPFEPALNSRLPDSMVLAELTTASTCACQQACLARHDCLSASTSAKPRKPWVEEIENFNLKVSKLDISEQFTCRLGRRRGHQDVNIADSASEFWERLGRSQLGDYCTESSQCITAGAVCHDSTCMCAAGLREDGGCHCPADTSAGEPCWFQTCAEVRSAGISDSSVYSLRHWLADGGHRVFRVRCEMTENNRGWTVIQARDMTIDNGGDFNRSMQEYLEKFGNVNDNYWLGLRLIREILQVGGTEQTLRIALQDADDVWDYAVYEKFNLDPEEKGFTLRVDGGYKTEEGTLGSRMTVQDGRKFSTYDADRDTSDDKNCAQLLGGGWWYHNCKGVSLNGAADISRVSRPGAINWPEWQGRNITKSLMMLRPRDK